jgi:hypothetical protein
MSDLKTVNIDLRKLKSKYCECGSKYFEVIYEIKDVPKVLSPTGQAGTITIQHYKCNNCGKILGNEVTN